MSTDADTQRETVEEIAAERDVPEQYADHLQPEYPKWASECSCDFAASSFDQSDAERIRGLGGSHAETCRDGRVEFVRYDQPDGDGETLAVLSEGIGDEQ